MPEERPIWGIHMERHHGAQPVTEGFIAIGWELVGDLSKLPANREAFKEAVSAAYPDAKPGAIPVVAGSRASIRINSKHLSLISWNVWAITLV